MNKNILYLLPTDENQYLNFFTEELKKYFNNLYVLNVVQFFSNNGLGNTEKYVQDLITDKKIDIVISTPFPTEYQLSVEFFTSLKNRTKMVFWMFDDEMYFDAHSKYYCQVADAVITGDYFSVSGYEKLGIPSIHYTACFSKQTYFPVEIKKDIDVCFLGNCKKVDRMKYINFLIENGISVETFGIGSKNGFVESGKLSEIFSRTKINIDFTKPELSWVNKDEPLINRNRVFKGRWIEVAFTKSFCLTEYAHCTNICFEIGKEIDVFHNKEELLEKVKFYLSNEKIREEMAENAYKKAIENYESEIYIPKVLKELEEILQKNNKLRTEKNEIFLSKDFKINSVNGLTFSMFVLLKSGKIKYSLELFVRLFKYGVLIFIVGFCGGLLRVIENIRHKFE